MKPRFHSKARWQQFTFDEQMGNAGSEVHRFITAKARGDERAADYCLACGLELFDLTLDDPRWDPDRKREVAQLRERFQTAATSNPTDAAALAAVDDYCFQRALVARQDR